jgi:hypothetical protein
MKKNTLKQRKQQLVMQGELLRYDLKLNLTLAREGMLLGETGIGLCRWLLERYRHHRA